MFQLVWRVEMPADNGKHDAKIPHAGRDPEAPQYQRVPCASCRLGGLQFRGCFLSRLQEDVRDCASHLATLEQIGCAKSLMAARPPEFGEQTDEVLAEFGFGAAEIAELRQGKVV